MEVVIQYFLLFSNTTFEVVCYVAINDKHRGQDFQYKYFQVQTRRCSNKNLESFMVLRNGKNRLQNLMHLTTFTLDFIKMINVQNRDMKKVYKGTIFKFKIEQHYK